jgi:hypothetical protein
LGEHKEAIEDFTSAIDYSPEILKNQIKTSVFIHNSQVNEFTKQKEHYMTHEVYFPKGYFETGEFREVFARPKKEKFLRSEKNINDVYSSEAEITIKEL